MTKKLTLRLTPIFVCALLCFISCEKHDGIYYLKSKCNAELNGQTYIDQQPYTYIFGPTRATPLLEYSQYEATFKTYLSTTRGGKIAYSVKINLFVDKPEEFLHKPQTMGKIDMAYTDTLISERDYYQYCKENKMSYATVNGEVIDGGTFEITPCNKTEGQTHYDGTFNLQFSEGTLKGVFWIEQIISTNI